MKNKQTNKKLSVLSKEQLYNSLILVETFVLEKKNWTCSGSNAHLTLGDAKMEGATIVVSWYLGSRKICGDKN